MKLAIRNIALSALLTIGAFSAVTYTACNKDACKGVVCQNTGVCTNGVCSCTTGYEGTLCETKVVSKFEKSWTASDKEVGGADLPTYSSAIVDGSSITEVKISNFSDLFTNDVKATASGTTLTIATQDPDGDGYKVSGSATYNATDKKLTWNYTVTQPITNATKTYSGTWQ